MLTIIGIIYQRNSKVRDIAKLENAHCDLQQKFKQCVKTRDNLKFLFNFIKINFPTMVNTKIHILQTPDIISAFVFFPTLFTVQAY